MAQQKRSCLHCWRHYLNFVRRCFVVDIWFFFTNFYTFSFLFRSFRSTVQRYFLLFLLLLPLVRNSLQRSFHITYKHYSSTKVRLNWMNSWRRLFDCRLTCVICFHTILLQFFLFHSFSFLPVVFCICSPLKPQKFTVRQCFVCDGACPSFAQYTLLIYCQWLM